MFGIGGFELFLILLFGFLLFGPDKLPGIAKTVGQGLAKFKNAQEEVTKVVQNEIYDPKSDEPFKNPLNAADKLAKKAEEARGKSSSAGKTVAKQESFSERKARYDRERAARKAAEAEKGEGAAAAAATTAAAKAKPAPKAAATRTTAAKPAAPKPAPNPANTPRPASAAKPAAKPAPKAASDSSAKPAPAQPAAEKPAATSEEKGE